MSLRNGHQSFQVEDSLSRADAYKWTILAGFDSAAIIAKRLNQMGPADPNRTINRQDVWFTSQSRLALDNSGSWQDQGLSSIIRRQVKE